MRMKELCLLAMLSGALSPALAQTNPAARQEQILTDAVNGGAPHFNGAQVIGIHPKTPLLYRFAVSGTRPMTLSASGLPTELELDPRTGTLTGTLKSEGKLTFTASAANAAGKVSAEFKIVCGGALALTPPLGWNSYDAFGDNVVESEVRANAGYLAEKMQQFGWDTVLVDYRWYDPGAHDNNPNGRANAPLPPKSFNTFVISKL